MELGSDRKINNLLGKVAQGKATADELSALREAAKSDAFLSEALEGYMTVESDQTDEITAVRSAIWAKSQRATRRPWIMAAGVIALLGLATFGLIQLGNQPSIHLVQQQDSDVEQDGGMGRRASPKRSEPADLEIGESANDETAFSATKEQHSTIRTIPEQRPSKKGLDTEAGALEESASTEVPNPLSNTAKARSKMQPLHLIQGRVFDHLGSPISHALIRQRGTEISTISDSLGQFSFSTPDTNQEVDVSHNDYVSRRISGGLHPRQSLEISLTPPAGDDKTQKIDLVRLADNKQSQLRPLPGWKDFDVYLTRHQVYPEAAKNHGIEGEVILSFGINATGAVTEIKILRSLGFGCDQEAIRLLQQGPKWTPVSSTDQTNSLRGMATITFTLK